MGLALHIDAALLPEPLVLMVLRNKQEDQDSEPLMHNLHNKLQKPKLNTADDKTSTLHLRGRDSLSPQQNLPT